MGTQVKDIRVDYDFHGNRVKGLPTSPLTSDEAISKAYAETLVGGVGPAGPQGDPGPQGSTGPQGIQGATGATGSQGIQGIQGNIGAQGPAGVGLPTGGTNGQILTKSGSADYNTVWTTDNSIINAIIFG